MTELNRLSLSEAAALEEPERAPTKVKFGCDGVAMMRCHRGLVEKGELLSMVGKIAHS